MKTHAFVLREHNNGDDTNAKDSVIELPTSQFMDFQGVGLVRAATKAEITASKKAPEAE